MVTANNDRLSLLSAPAEARVFHELQHRLFHNRLMDAWSRNRLRLIVVAVLSSIFWGIVFYLFVDGFYLLRTTIAHEATRATTVRSVFNLFFLSLLVMITISSSIIFFSIAYRGRDVATCMTLPIRPRTLALMKLRESLLFGGWGFFLLGSPMLWAYGVSAGSPWYYFVAVIPFMVAFVTIPVALGCIGCMLAMRFVPRFRLHAAVAICLLPTLVAIAITWSVVREARSHQAFSIEWLEGTLSQMKFAQQQLLPNWWLSSGLLEAAHPAARAGRESWRESLGFLAVLGSNALLMYHLAGGAAGRWYAAGYSELVEFTRPEPQLRSGRLDRVANAALCLFSPATRILFIKDLRIFFRDIMQWSQFAIFAGLLSIYFLNIRRLQAGAQFVGWLVLIGFLNIGVVGLLWATFTTRFVYPLLSLEGRRFWVLGTAPLPRRTILWSKFLFAVALGMVPCCLLVLLSDLMLGISDFGAWLLVLHQITSVSLCLGLAGIAVGLGAWLPNLQESAPAKIATGYGGTLTLVISVLFIISLILVTALPVWGWSLGSTDWNPTGVDQAWLRIIGTPSGLTAGILATILLGILATFLPLYVGLKSFERIEL